MGYASQEGHFGFITQPTEGVFTDPSANGVFIRHLSGSLGANRELIIPDPEIGGDRDVTQAVMGTVSYSGDLEFYVRMEMLPTLLKAALGSVATTQDTPETDAHTHVITPIDSVLSLPYLSVEEKIGANLDTFRYTDVRVNSFGLECEPNGIFMGSVGLIARTQLAGVTPATPALVDTTPLTVGTSMAVTIGGVSTYINRDFSLEYTNNIEDDVFELGDIDLADLTPKRRELSASFTIRPTGANAKNLWRQATYGATAATGPQSGAAFETSLSLSIATFTNIGATATPYSLNISIPNAVVEPFPLEPSGDDVIEYSVTLRAIRPSAGTPLATFTIVNGLDSVL